MDISIFSPIFLPPKKEMTRTIPKDFGLTICGFWVMTAENFVPKSIEIRKYMDLWGWTLVVIVIPCVDIFQKIVISEYHCVSQTQIDCPTPQSNQFSLIFDIFQTPSWIPLIKNIFFWKSSQEKKIFVVKFEKKCSSTGN